LKDERIIHIKGNKKKIPKIVNKEYVIRSAKKLALDLPILKVGSFFFRFMVVSLVIDS